mmetsp:Transcript_10659/g.33115  ORF Transcript_10659/g.33115 Transcript_10659/m.33115 type:complete len:503 (-) Transcript_10659:72-1580(-)
MRCAACYVLLAALGLAAEESCPKDTGGTCTFFGCHPSRGPTDCVTESLFHKVCLCKEGYCARNGVCRPAAPSTTTTPAPTPAPTLDEQCTKAYASRCYAKSPFKSCCHEGQCQAGLTAVTCHWGFEMPCCPDLFDAKFEYIPGMDSNCQKACGALGDKRNDYIDFCPDGRLPNLPEVKACPAAQDSLDKALGARAWCSSNASLGCEWLYSIYREKKGEEEHVQGSFHFGPNSFECSEACTRLGNPSNKPSEYCGDSALLKLASGCPPAAESLKAARVQGAAWCSEAGAVSLAQSAKGRGKISPVAQDWKQKPAAVRVPASNRSFLALAPLELADSSGHYDQQCHDAFRAGCWGKAPFDECCGTCAHATSTHQCSWSFTFNGQQIGDTIASYGGESWKDCDTACDTLGRSTNDPMWYCSKTELLGKLGQCAQAKASLERKSKSAAWCPKSTALSSSTGTTPGVDPTRAAAAAAVLAIMTTAAVAVKSRSRQRADEGDYERFLG